MGCNCNKGNAKGTYRVQNEGKIVYTSTRKEAAEAVQARYPGSVILEPGNS